VKVNFIEVFVLNIKQRNRLIVTLFSSFLLGYISPGAADAPSPLDVDQHPSSPRYESLFPDQVVPLDTQLSWKHRFLGNESFNAEEKLPSTSPVIDQSSINSAGESSINGGGTKSGGFDTTGVIKQVKLSEGKVKIKHGPIERLGMPAMTMMFRVEDSNQLAGLEKGAEVSFNVDNTAAGFSITHLEASSTSFDTTGVVKQVKISDGKVKIEHGPIDRLGMPGMTMMFRVQDISQLNGVEKGANVAFNVDNSSAGFSITKLKLVGEDPDNPFDANGTVKSIRPSQGKVKIEHGPIDRLGMPGMTMLFKVKNPDDLAALERDMQVEFNVVNGPGGFEISLIKPMAAVAAKTGSKVIGKGLCYAIGPFRNRAKAQAVSGRYQERGAITKLSSSDEREYIGDMVYIDDLGTRNAALSTAKDLKARGITDYIILNEPGKQNALSLGIFGSKQNAERLKARVEAMNISVKTEARYRERTIYWLHNEQLSVTEPLELLTVEDLESGISQVPDNCKAGGDA
jgi:Cu/Ag efflux protein CusF